MLFLIIDELDNDSFVTGIAACNVGGVTIHSFAGIGIGAEQAEHLVSRVRKNKKAMTRWLRTQVLIIDEGAFVYYACCGLP